jgi:oxygen-independent coproporphyrinogen-3 oxidase
MAAEYVFDVENASSSDIWDQLIEAEAHVPGLVFSYPPISTWRPENSADLAPEDLWQGSDVFSHNLYIHIPFCRQKCSFCYYSVAVVQDDTEIIWDYLRCLEKEAVRYAETTHRHARIETVFVGGGTPSRLNEDQLAFLFDRVIGRFDLSACREITYECSPDSATKGRIDMMAKLGVNRLSMGVQTLDPEILRKSRRGDSPDEVVQTYHHMVASGIPNVNIDLIAGIEKEALSNMERTMDAVAALDVLPTQITLFTLSVREGAINKTTLRQEDPAALFRRSVALFRYAKRRMVAMGYWQYSRNLFPRDNWIFHYQDNHWGNNGYVLALGASGYSHSHGYTYLNAFNYRDYMRRMNAGESTVERLFPLSPDESLRRHLVLAMKHAELDIARFESFYPAGSKPLERFVPVFRALEAVGAVTIDDHKIRYTPDFADLSDRFVRLFYSPEANRRIKEDAVPVSRRADAFSFTI